MDMCALGGAASNFGSGDRLGGRGRGSNLHITDDSELSQ